MIDLFVGIFEHHYACMQHFVCFAVPNGIYVYVRNIRVVCVNVRNDQYTCVYLRNIDYVLTQGMYVRNCYGVTKVFYDCMSITLLKLFP